MAVGYAVGPSATAPAFFTSGDLLTWAQAPALPTATGGNAPTCLAKHGSTLLIGCNGVYYRSADDGATWTAITFPVSFFAFAYHGGRWVGVGSTGIVYSDDDGLTWSVGVGVANIRAVIWDGTRFVAAGDSNTLYTSADGATWTAPTRSGASLGNVYGLLYTGALYVAVGANITTSPDGLAWTRRTGSGLKAITRGDTYYLAAGTSTYRSTDGITWSSIAGVTANDVKAALGLFVYGATSGVWTSPDGTGSVKRLDYSLGITGLVLNPNSPPNAPALTSPADGSTIDRSVTQRLAWVFSDPDVGDSQSKFDLRYRLIGAGTWTDVTGTTPNTFWDAPPATFTSGDFEWQARTYDALGVVGPYSASSFFTAATAPAAPTITAPVSGGPVAVTDTLTWSTPDQDAYQARRVADNAGTANPGTVYWDTGEVTDAGARSLTVPFPTNNRWEWIQVRVRDGGLWSQWASVRVQVSWTAPAAPGVVLTPTAATASLAVAITNPAPSGGEPTVSYNDVWLSAPGVPEFRAATLVPPNSTWTFWTPASGLDYTARVVSVATNGTTAETTVA